MSCVRSDHRIVFKVGDHGDEDTPSLDFLTDTEESITSSISNLDGLQSSSHLFDLILHLSDIHVSPFQFQIVVESIVAFLDVLPKFKHPSDLNLDIFDDLIAACSLALREFEHLLVINELVQGLLFTLDALLVLGDSLEAALYTSVVVIEAFFLKIHLHLFESVFKLFDSFFGLNSLNVLRPINFFFDLSSNKSDSLVIFHQLDAFLHLEIFLLLISLLKSLQNFFNSI